MSTAKIPSLCGFPSTEDCSGDTWGVLGSALVVWGLTTAAYISSSVLPLSTSCRCKCPLDFNANESRENHPLVNLNSKNENTVWHGKD